MADAKGDAVTEGADELYLHPLNEGTVPTSVRHNGESIVDVTWASPSLVNRVRGWVVRVDEESLSNHAYIRMSVVGPKGRVSLDRGNAWKQRRWALKELDREELLEAVRTSSRARAGARVASAEEGAKWLARVLQRASDAAMPRAGTRLGGGRRAAYW